MIAIALVRYRFRVPRRRSACCCSCRWRRPRSCSAPASPRSSSRCGVPKGFDTIILAHTMFCISFVVVTVKARVASLDPALEEAGRDLYGVAGAGVLAHHVPAAAPGHPRGGAAVVRAELRRLHHHELQLGLPTRSRSTSTSRPRAASRPRPTSSPRRCSCSPWSSWWSAAAGRPPARAALSGWASAPGVSVSARRRCSPDAARHGRRSPIAGARGPPEDPDHPLLAIVSRARRAPGHDLDYALTADGSAFLEEFRVDLPEGGARSATASTGPSNATTSREGSAAVCSTGSPSSTGSGRPGATVPSRSPMPATRPVRETFGVLLTVPDGSRPSPVRRPSVH